MTPQQMILGQIEMYAQRTTIRSLPGAQEPPSIARDLVYLAGLQLAKWKEVCRWADIPETDVAEAERRGLGGGV